MRPRLLFRTHYQVEEPAYVEFLVKRCTSATQSSYNEVVAARLKEEVERRCQTSFNLAASKYAVDLARALGLLTPNNTWTARGHLVDVIAEVDGGDAEEQLTLTRAEKLLHFRLFLENDGAAFVSIARYLVENRLLAHAEAMTTPFVEEMFGEILSTYLSMTSNVADRVALRRQVDQLKQRGYASKTRQHKLHIHMQTLYRLGLVARRDTADGILYQLPDEKDEKPQGLETLLCEVPDLSTLEKRMAAREWPRIACNVIGVSCSDGATVHVDTTYVLSLLADVYRKVMSVGIPICPLSTVIEAAQILALVQRRWLLEHAELMKLIAEEQTKRPTDIRFHVDRRGRPAFVRFSERWTGDILDE